MLRQIRQLFQRYCLCHLSVALPGFALPGEGGRKIGYLDRIELCRGRLFIEGWTEADRVILADSGDSTEIRPNVPRADVVKTSAAGEHFNIGFRIDRPVDPAGMWLVLVDGQTRNVYSLSLPAGAALRRRRLLLVPRFVAALTRASPAILRWRLSRDPAARARVKALLGFREERGGVPLLPARLFREAPAPAPPAGSKVTLILPVYNAFELLPEALDRVLRHTDLPWHLVVIEDRSTDARVRPWLRDWVDACEAERPGRVTLIENSENRGFIGSVNEGLRIACGRGDHVILLNSDAFVPEGWTSRLLEPILTGDRVASVTPMSNDAEILSVPAICRPAALAPGQADRVDAVARRLDAQAALAELPTGVGFCMAMNIRYLRHEPRLDTGFGQGYGEEVDWCQKVRARGGRHLGTGALFVEHRGGASFGSAEKRILVARNNATISARYPGYDAEVQGFIRDDPLAVPRLALALALAAARAEGPVPVYLAHSLGGGAERDLERRIAEAAAAGAASVVLRVGGPWRWQIELHGHDGSPLIAATQEFDRIETILACLPARRIVYSCAVGDPDPMQLPELLLRLRKPPHDRLQVLVHDFFPLSPSYCLLGSDGRFSGVPAADDPDPAHVWHRPRGGRVSLADWRGAWGRLLAAADEVVAFSEDSADHVRAAYPAAAAALTVRPHRLLSSVPRVSAPAAERPVIGVLGNIGFQKGAQVVVDLAHLVEREGGAKLVLVGNIDPDFTLPASAVLHGDYRVEDIPGLVARYRITHWLIPSVWPETFSFTTHEALATGMPVLCFDLGAQAEVVRGAPNGRIIPLGAGTDPAQAVLTELRKLVGERVGEHPA